MPAMWDLPGTPLKAKSHGAVDELVHELVADAAIKRHPSSAACWRMSLCLHRFRCKRSCGDRGARSRRCGGSIARPSRDRCRRCTASPSFLRPRKLGAGVRRGRPAGLRLRRLDPPRRPAGRVARAQDLALRGLAHLRWSTSGRGLPPAAAEVRVVRRGDEASLRASHQRSLCTTSSNGRRFGRLIGFSGRSPGCPRSTR